MANERGTDDSIMEFPCEFPIKMMGRATPEFHVTVRELVEKHTGGLDDAAFQSAESRNGRFVSITVTITADSREQLDAIYHDLTDHDDVLMAL